MAISAIGTGIWAILLTSGVYDISIEDLRAKYETPASKYVELDGIDIHYIDEGEGPVVVLSNASYHTTRAWDGMVQNMTDRFRIIRFDFPGNGLSGLDTQGRYSPELYGDVITLLTDSLGINKFHLVGTSSGGTVAFRYAAANPEKIDRFVLINSAGMPRTAVTNPNRERGSAFGRWVSKNHQSKDWWRASLSQTITKRPPFDWHVEMNYDMNRRDDRHKTGALFRRNYITGDPSAVLRDITAPTAIFWGIKNPTVMHLEANVIQLWMTGAPTIIKKYEELGHYPYIEEPELVASDISAFLTGDWDDQLRQTQRVKPEDLLAANAN
ncbi:MAG: alpha/beta hydrolase [Rhodospirillaceae bacterium]|nr:alpha/beta hydrolase [Rhodospirillaceae bacterium]